MIEKHLILEEIDPVAFYGVKNSHLQVIKGLFPKLRIVARDNVIKVLGDEENIASFEDCINRLQKHILHFNALGIEQIIDIVKDKETRVKDDNVVVYSITGRPVKARTQNQQRLIDAFNQNDMVFAVGPAGTGKTYLSIALAVKALKEKSIKRIILSRPAVEAGEKLGFLPGDMNVIRCVRRHDSCREAARHDGEKRYSDRTTCLHARTDTLGCRRHTRRSAKHDRGANPNVSDPYGMEYKNDHHW